MISHKETLRKGKAVFRPRTSSNAIQGARQGPTLEESVPQWTTQVGLRATNGLKVLETGRWGRGYGRGRCSLQPNLRLSFSSFFPTLIAEPIHPSPSLRQSHPSFYHTINVQSRATFNRRNRSECEGCGCWLLWLCSLLLTWARWRSPWRRPRGGRGLPRSLP